MNRTMSGYPCQRWSLTVPHDHQFTGTGDHNFCRNPVDSGVDQLWCYANTTKFEWEYCLVPFCSSSEDISGCQHKRTKGRDYRGKANTTVTGIACQTWSNTTPHKHTFTRCTDAPGFQIPVVQKFYSTSIHFVIPASISFKLNFSTSSIVCLRVTQESWIAQ